MVYLRLVAGAFVLVLVVIYFTSFAIFVMEHSRMPLGAGEMWNWIFGWGDGPS